MSIPYRPACRHTMSALMLVAALNACREQGAAPTAKAPSPSRPDAWFRDATVESGLDFRHRSDLDGSFFMPQNIGSGAAVFDYDGDGDLDLYLVASGSHRKDGEVSSANRLYRLDADGRYDDRTGESRLGDTGYGMGCAVGDVDADGDIDLYVTNYGPDALYINDGAGRFTETTAAAGLGDETWSTSACFFDYDRDGALDLYVATYVHYDEPKACTDQAGRPEYCGPAAFRGLPDLLYRNRGDGTFVRMLPGGTETLNKGLGVVCTDLDGDGWDDVYVANDGEPNTLWINLEGAGFEDRGLLLGAATNALGQPEASMGIALGDVDADADLDLFLTHLDRETNTLYLNLGDGFRDATAQWGVGRVSLPYTGFGTAFFDAENDGDLDLVLVNGRVRRGPPQEHSDVDGELPAFWRDYAEPNLFYLNDGDGALHNSSELAGELTGRREVSRGLVTADLDGDGDLDVLVTHSNGAARIYLNEAPEVGHWLGLSVAGHGLGARVRVETRGESRLGVLSSTYSYASSVEPALHFGLGAADRVDRLSVDWPGGPRQAFTSLPADRRLRLVRKGN